MMQQPPHNVGGAVAYQARHAAAAFAFSSVPFSSVPKRRRRPVRELLGETVNRHDRRGAGGIKTGHQPYTGLGITVETIGGELHGKPIGAFGVALHGLAGLGL